MTPTVLFDLDGTLVDTVYLHTLAWWRALEAADEHTAMSRIQPLVGLAGGDLLQALLGRDDEKIGERHGEEFAAMHGEVRPLPGARDLLRKVAELGGRSVVVTSAKQRDLDVLLGALDCDDVVHEVVSELPVPGKPAPDLFSIGLARAGSTAEEAVVVGDSVWDMEAAARSGVAAIGLQTGGTPPARLHEAGAGAVYESCAELLDVWPTTVLAALLSGGSVRPSKPPGKVGEAPRPAVESGSHGAEVTRQLELEHQRARRFLADLRQLSDDRSRREAFFELAARLAQHETAEEASVYPVLAGIEGCGDLRDEALAQEAELKRLLVRLQRRVALLPRGRGLERRLDLLSRTLERHARLEEERIFPLLRTARDAGDRQMMGAWLEHSGRVAPLRAHPHAPQRSAALVVAFAPAVSLVDRMRERARRLAHR